ncbi:MAG: hypothetical protein HY513_02510 [Candidatus Aenigmarchaeota archaeon]|nr:hypothetical protein [Candidatus Aenigmarchaeota archaeon]
MTTREEKSAKARDRPLGIKILSILGMIWSALSIPVGISAFILSKYMEAYSVGQSFGQMAGSFETAGTVSIIMGIVSLFAFYLLLKMKKTGWSFVMVLSIASIIVGVIFALMYGILFLMNSIFSAVVSIMIMIYLWTKKDLFV